MIVIGFCGLPGAGKSTAIAAIEDLGKVVTMGDVIRNEAKKRGLAPSGENLGKIAKELREKHGEDIIARLCVDLIKQLNENIIFIDGIRSMIEVNTFRNHWPLPVIAIEMSDDERFKRLKERARSDDPRSLEDLKTRDNRELGFGVGEVLSNADYVLKNNCSLEEFKEKTRNLVEETIEELSSNR